MTTTSRKVLLPLATLVAAGAVAIGSGATWTSTTEASVDVTSGELMHENLKDGAALTIDNIIPGDSMTGTVEVENTGDVDSTLDIAVSGVDNSFSDFLTITVLEGTDELYSGPFEDLAIDQSETDVEFAVGDVVTYTFTVTLDADADNADQNQSAGATFTWTQTQVDGDGNLLENWV